jgi:hypothetical protein
MPGEKTFASEEVLTAADMTTYFVQQAVVIKSADETVASSTTNQNDNELSIAVDANTTYWVECFLIYAADPSADIKVTYNGPSGTTMQWCADGLVSSSTAVVDNVSRSLQGLANTPSHGGITNNTTVLVAMHKGVLTTGGSSGNLTLQWAQLASSANATRVYAGSTLVVTRVS